MRTKYKPFTELFEYITLNKTNYQIYFYTMDDGSNEHLVYSIKRFK